MGEDRLRRVNRLLKQEIANLLTRGLRDPLPAFTTVTEVRVTPDLRNARVAVSVMASEAEREATLALLKEQKGWVRREVGRVVRMKHTPQLFFELDTSLDRVDRLEELFGEISRDRVGEDPDGDLEEGLQDDEEDGQDKASTGK